MMVIRIILILLASGLVGCGSMFPAYHLNSDQSHWIGRMEAGIDNCVKVGHFTRQDGVPFMSSLIRARTVVEFDKRAYAQAVTGEQIQSADQLPVGYCQELRPILGEMVQILDRHYYAAAEFHGRKADEWSAAMSRVGTYGPPPAPVVVVQPSGGPTYQTPRQSSTEHVLRRDGSTVGCTTTSSGVVVCQ
jgi:hypothetical protein